MFWQSLSSGRFTSLSLFVFRNVNNYQLHHPLYSNSYHSLRKDVFRKNQNDYVNLMQQIKCRCLHNKDKNSRLKSRHTSTIYYTSALVIFTLGMTYAAVPLYRIFCQAFSYGGTLGIEKDLDLSGMKKNASRELTIKFNADVNSSLNWKFQPQLREIKVLPGETALAFYTAENPLDRPVVGISTYNVVPFEAGPYFNKIQCFCFEEQMLNPREQVDMPVFFYIDPEYVEDPKLEYINEILLSYTFFEVKDGMNLPIPSYHTPHNQ